MTRHEDFDFDRDDLASLELPLDKGGDCPACRAGNLAPKILPNGREGLGCNSCGYQRYPREAVESAPGHGKVCPACGSGKMLTVKLASIHMLACSNYPRCNHCEWVADSDACPVCRRLTMRTGRVRKVGPNQGRLFRACTSAGCKYFSFLPEHGGRGHAER